jgi:hypothetical protein
MHFNVGNGLFDWPITKKNTITMDKVEDYISVPFDLAILITRVKFWAKEMG